MRIPEGAPRPPQRATPPSAPESPTQPRAPRTREFDTEERAAAARVPSTSNNDKPFNSGYEPSSAPPPTDDRSYQEKLLDQSTGQRLSNAAKMAALAPLAWVERQTQKTPEPYNPDEPGKVPTGELHDYAFPTEDTTPYADTDPDRAATTQDRARRQFIEDHQDPAAVDHALRTETSEPQDPQTIIAHPISSPNDVDPRKLTHPGPTY